jgi:hypothetical protein
VTVRRLIPLLPATLLGAGAAVLVSCGSSGAGLIPAENAGPLLSDFQAVEQAALKGDGNCAPTEAALSTTERDFQTLPRSVDAGLHGRLQEGIANLRTRALEMCAEPLAQTTTTGESTSTTRTPAPPSSTTKTQPEPTSTTPTTSTTGTGVVPSTPAPSGPGGGTPAPGVGGSSENQAGEGAGGNAQEGSEEAKGGGAGVGGGTGSGGGGQ